jgi:hypothetical protein
MVALCVNCFLNQFFSQIGQPEIVRTGRMDPSFEYLPRRIQPQFAAFSV